VRDRFERFDRWARRAVAADPAFGSRAELEETLFAPLRREDDVHGAWIARGNARTLVYGPREAPPSEAIWVRVRDGTLGEVDVTAAKLPPLEGEAEGHADRCTLVRRVQPGSDGVDVSVVLAIRAE
jgi:hypothetical protein